MGFRAKTTCSNIYARIITSLCPSAGRQRESLKRSICSWFFATGRLLLFLAGWRWLDSLLMILMLPCTLFSLFFNSFISNFIRCFDFFFFFSRWYELCWCSCLCLCLCLCLMFPYGHVADGCTFSVYPYIYPRLMMSLLTHYWKTRLSYILHIRIDTDRSMVCFLLWLYSEWLIK